MTLDANQLRDLQDCLGDRLYLKVASWNLYLKDAGLAESLAIECSILLPEGVSEAASKAIESVFVSLGGGSFKLPLSQLMPKELLKDLEEILEDYA